MIQHNTFIPDNTTATIQVPDVTLFGGYAELPCQSCFLGKSNKVYILKFTSNLGMLPSDPTGSLDDYFYRFFILGVKV